MVEGLVSLQEDIAQLDACLTELRAKGRVAAVVIDPISAYMGKADTHKSSEVRNALGKLVAVIQKHDVLCLAINHRNKSMADVADALDAANGSQAFTALARGNLFVGRDPENPDSATRIMKPHGYNISADDTPAWSFDIKSALFTRSEDAQEFPTSRGEWGKVRPDVDPLALLKATANKAREASKADEVAMLIRDFMKVGKAVARSEVVEHVKERSAASERTIQRAALEVVRVKFIPASGYKTKGAVGGQWLLTQQAADAFEKWAQGGPLVKHLEPEPTL
jgi:putative DNA primase/helicase